MSRAAASVLDAPGNTLSGVAEARLALVTEAEAVPAVGDRDDVPGAVGELNELGKRPVPGDVERDVDAVGRERANPLDEALGVGVSEPR